MVKRQNTSTNLDRFSQEIQIFFRDGIDTSEWEYAHSCGELPDRWPYGLDKLDVRGAKVVSKRAARWGFHLLLSACSALAFQGRNDFHRIGRPGSVALAWEENTAASLLRLGEGTAIRGAGVIWLTDPPKSLKGRMIAPLLWAILRRMDFVWCLSEAQAQVLRDHLAGRDRPRVFHAHFGIDVQFFARKPNPMNLTVFSAGNDSDRDIATLLRAMELVHNKIPAARLILQCDRNIAVPDFVEHYRDLTHTEMRAFYEQSAVVAVALRQNRHVSGMTVALEAMSIGRPVVITSTIGMDEYVRDGVDGLLTAPGSPEDMATAITRLLVDSSLAAEMGRAGSHSVTTKFTSAKFAGRLLDIVDDLSNAPHTVNSLL